MFKLQGYTTEFTDQSEFMLKSDGVRVYLSCRCRMKILEAMYLEDGKKQETLRQIRKQNRRRKQF